MPSPLAIFWRNINYSIKNEHVLLGFAYLIYAKETSCHGRAVHRFGGILVSFFLMIGHRVPIELEIPIEAAHINAAAVMKMVLECSVVDHVDDRAHDRRGIPGYAVQQGLYPARGAFAVRIEVGEDFARGVRSTWIRIKS